jgi:hypothetical protein
MRPTDTGKPKGARERMTVAPAAVERTLFGDRAEDLHPTKIHSRWLFHL